MNKLSIAATVAALAGAAGLWEAPPSMIACPLRYGRKPSGAAAAKRAAKRRRNIAKRPRAAHKCGGNAWTRAGRPA
jgi:hypothetical protein